MKAYLVKQHSVKLSSLSVSCMFVALFLGVVSSSQNAYGVCDAFREDLEHYTQPASSPEVYPLISKDIIGPEGMIGVKRGEKAAVTLCTTPLNLFVSHVSLVFELIVDSPPDKNSSLKLFNVHFGGDGDAQSGEGKTRVTIDNARQTLRKVYRGQRISVTETSEEIPPLYKREMTWVVPQPIALEVLMGAENEKALTYTLWGGFQKWNGNSYNCCTYVSKLLFNLGIRVNSVCAYTLVRSCRSFEPFLPKDTSCHEMLVQSQKSPSDLTVDILEDSVPPQEPLPDSLLDRLGFF